MLSSKTVGVAALAAVCLILGVLQEANADPDACGNTVVPLAAFDAKKFEGKWFEISKSLILPTMFPDTCNYITYILEPLSNEIITSYNFKIGSGSQSVAGNLQLNPDGSGKLTGLFYYSGLPANADYIILDTDYNKYALVYLCVDYNEDQKAIIWVFSQQPEIDGTTSAYINSKIEENGLDVNSLIPATQDCES